MTKLRLRKLLPSPEIIITPDFNSITQTFQNISHIGELRQRWLEIKKLQTGAVLYDVGA